MDLPSDPLKSVVAIVGEEDLQNILASCLGNQFKSILVHGGAAEFTRQQSPPDAAQMEPSSTERKGVLRADWIQKHQLQVPAVVIVVTPLTQAVGDPSAWAALAAQLGLVRAAAKRRAVRIIIAVALRSGQGELSNDRAIMIARQAGVDRSCVTSWAVDHEASTQSLCDIVASQALEFYGSDAKRRIASYNNLNSVDANLRAAFKIAALGELRGDWADAARLYTEAYSYVSQLSMSGPVPLQRFLEVRAVAELVNMRLLIILIVVLKLVEEAAKQLDRHIRLFAAVPLQPVPLALAGNHEGWLARQYAFAASLLLSAGIEYREIPSHSRPGEMYIAAAQAAIKRRHIQGRIVHGRDVEGVGGVLQAGRYVGKYEISGNKSPSDADVERLLLLEELALDHRTAGIDSLRKALNDGRTPIGQRLQAKIYSLLGKEYCESRGWGPALEALQHAAARYRRDAWSGPLRMVLSSLRECMDQLKDSKHAPIVELELAALSNDVHAATAGLALLRQCACAEYAVEGPGSPWYGLIRVASGFSGDWTFTIGLYSSVPVPLDVSVKVVFARDGCNGDEFEIPANGGRQISLATRQWIAIDADLTSSTTSCTLTASRVIITPFPEVSVSYVLPGGLWPNLEGLSHPQASWGIIKSDLPTIHTPPKLTMFLPEMVSLGEICPCDVVIEAGDQGIQECSVVMTAAGSAAGTLSKVDKTSWSSECQTYIGELGPGETLSQELMLTATSPGELVLTAQLRYVAIVVDTHGRETKEAGNTVVQCSLEVAIPFHVDMSVAPRNGQRRRVMPDKSLKEPDEVPCLQQLDVVTQSLGPSLPVRVVITGGDAMLVSFCVQSMLDIPIQVLEITWEEFPEQIIAPVAIEHSSIVLTAKGTACVASFTVPEITQKESIPSLGKLRLKWRRSEPISLIGYSTHDNEVRKSRRTETSQLLEVTSCLRLPAALVFDPLLTAAVHFPAHASVGEPLLVEIALESSCVAAIEVKATVEGHDGFLLDGPRAMDVGLPPHGQTRLAFCLVPLQAGFVHLPQVILDTAHGTLCATQDCTVFVQPAMMC